MAAAPKEQLLARLSQHVELQLEETRQTLTQVNGALEDSGKELERVSKGRGPGRAADVESVKSTIKLYARRLSALQQTEEILALQLKMLSKGPASTTKGSLVEEERVEEERVEEERPVKRASESGEIRRRARIAGAGSA